TTTTSTTTTTTLYPGCNFPPPYTPLDAGALGIPTSGLVLWLRADVGLGLDTATGTRACIWQDQSGNGLDVKPVDPTSGPLFEATGVGGLPALHSTGTERMLRGDVLGIGATSARTFVSVMAPVSLTGRANHTVQYQPFSSAFFGPDLNTYLTAGMRLGFYCTGNSFD